MVQLPGLVGSYSVESGPSEDVLRAPGLGFPGFPPSNGVCSCYRAVCALGVLTNRFVWDQRDRGKWSAAWGLPGVHTAFVWVRCSSAEPAAVQRAGGRGK